MSRARIVLLAVVGYFCMGLITGVVLIRTGGPSDYHWLGTLMVSILWWPALLFGTVVYFLIHR